jgi:hypothetical protein
MRRRGSWTVVLKGGVGCLLSMVMQFGGDPGTLTVLNVLTLYCADNEVSLDVGRRRRISATSGRVVFNQR